MNLISDLRDRFRVLITEGGYLKEFCPKDDIDIEYRRATFITWCSNVSGWLTDACVDLALFGEWMALDTPPAVSYSKYCDPDFQVEHAFKQNMKDRLNWLVTVHKQQSQQIQPRGVSQHPSRKVFLVHGHDEGSLYKVARFLEKECSLEPIILHEQPNNGRTIIEKFEDYADVPYAIVLLTPDDRGGPKDTLEMNFQFRARQNVVFELGFFIGMLGRRRVCCLHKKTVEILSDYQGVLWEPLDENDGWKIKLLRELKAAGLTPQPVKTDT